MTGAQVARLMMQAEDAIARCAPVTRVHTFADPADVVLAEVQQIAGPHITASLSAPHGPGRVAAVRMIPPRRALAPGDPDARGRRVDAHD